MLAWFRKLLGNWIARVFFGLLVVVFVFWGISNVVTLVGNSTTIAHVAGAPVDLAAVQAEFRAELNAAEQRGAVTPDQRQQIAQSALATVLRQRALAAAEQSLGIVAPDASVRTDIDQTPAFQTAGVFDQAKFEQVLAQNNYTADRYIGEVKTNLENEQLVQALIGGVAPPAPLVAQIFAFVSQARTAGLVTIQAAAQPPPAAPDEATLRRFWKNHPDKYTAPEFRTIKLVILSPAVLAANEPVSDAELQAAYARVAATQTVPATRSVQVVTGGDQAKLAKLAADWKSGASWAAIQAEAAKVGAVAVELDNQQADQLPSQPLSTAVFAAKTGQVTGPLPGTFGYFVFDVTGAQAAGAPSFAQVSAQLKQQIQLQKAQQEVNQDVDNVQDALAGQTPLDKLPGNLGLTALQGTLDAGGDTLDGAKAPIPGGDALRTAVVKAVFAGHLGDPAQLISGPDNSYFAFTIDRIIPPAVTPYDQVKAQVAADWQADQMAREAEQKAATLLQVVNAGSALDAAALAAGVPVTTSPPLTRGASPPDGIPETLVTALFAMKPGQATMQQTSGGFLVAVLEKVDQPTEAQDPVLVDSITQALDKGLQSDVVESFLGGLQSREHVTVEPKLLAQIDQ